MDQLSLYDYQLPQRLIAVQPLPGRSDSRLMVLRRSCSQVEHRRVCELPEILHAGDRLVLNDTRVIPARLLGERTQTGGKWEGLYLGTNSCGDWRMICQTRGRLLADEVITVWPAGNRRADDALRLVLREQGNGGEWTARPLPVAAMHDADVLALLHRFGTVPLPPYIGRQTATPDDWDRYQTTYATRPGAIAAPTAGLHLTPELLAEFERRGIGRSFLTLHTGIGTFRPITSEYLGDHQMHPEWCEISDETVEAVAAARQSGGRVVAVGTTTVRALESVARNGKLCAWQGGNPTVHPAGV